MAEKIIFVNTIGQSYIANKVKEEGGVLYVQRPAALNLEVLENGQIRLKMFPLIFPEFLKEDNAVYPFKLSDILIPQTGPSDAVAAQHDQVFAIHAPAPAPQGPPAIKLFEEV